MREARNDDNEDFRFALSRPGDGVIVMHWAGHLDCSGFTKAMRAVDNELADHVALVVDARMLEGYDPDVHDLSREWSQSVAASRLRAVAIVADSQLVAAESPAASLAPHRLARPFGTLPAAIAHARDVSVGRSGEYERLPALARKRAIADD